MTDSVIRLLLVEDDEDDYVFTRHLLNEARTHRFEVVWADRMESALNYLNDSKVDIILLDLSLPDSFGWETFTRVRAHAPDVPIVLLTGVQDEELGTKAVHAGAQDYLIKGDMSTQLLTRSITYAIERLKAQDALQSAYREMEALINQRTRELALAQQQLQIETGRRERVEQTLRDGNNVEVVCAFVDSVAVKFKGLVGAIREVAATLALPHSGSQESQGHCDRILAAADSADDLSSHLASLAHAVGMRPPQLEAVEPSQLLRATVSRHKDRLSDQGIMVRISDLGSASTVRVDPEQLTEIVRRVLHNAHVALPDGGEVFMTVSEPIASELSPAGGGAVRFVAVDILCAGVEASDDLLDRLLYPEGFAEGDALRKAPPGLQVALIERRVKGWGGAVQANRSDQGGGLRLWLPAVSEERLRPSAQVSHLLADGQILIVDDDKDLLSRVQAALEQVGYVVRVAPHHEEGLELLSAGGGVSIVLLDAFMPDQGAWRVMERLQKQHPNVAALVMSGFCRDYVQSFIPGKNWSFLQKPFDDEQVVEAVNALVRRHFPSGRS